MEITDEAVEAGAKALWATGGTGWDEADADNRAYHRDSARDCLTAALPHLRNRTVPNTVEALEGLGVGTVLRANYAIERLATGWAGRAYGDGQRSSKHVVRAARAIAGITEWTVLWEGGSGE